MINQKASKTAEDARQCLEQAVHDELVKKAKLGQDVIINRGGKPYKIPASEALRVQEEGDASYSVKKDDS